MKQLEDNKTAEMFGAPKRPRGRPASGKAMSAAQRQAKRRERLAGEGKGFVTFELPVSVIEGLDEFVRFKDVTKSEVVAKVLRQQLLRKR